MGEKLTGKVTLQDEKLDALLGEVMKMKQQLDRIYHLLSTNKN